MEGLILIPVIGGILELNNIRVGLYATLLTFLGSILVWLGAVDGIDGISMYFVLLTTIIIPLCVIGNNDTKQVGSILIMEGILIGVFTVTDVLWFYIAYEAVLIPMYMIVLKGGKRERRIRAGYYFFLYTLWGSLWMLLGILMIYWETGTTSYEVWRVEGLSTSYQYILWWGFFVSFAVKVPMVPVHIWLPEAHVEAPTVGSVILAAILLKLGTYGLIRYSVGILKEGTEVFAPVVFVIGMIGVVYTSLTAIRQKDMKRIIAYASVAHMSLTVIGLFSLTVEGVEGSIVQMLAHGLVSGGLFMCVGVIYDRYGSRLVKEYSGVDQVMPVYGLIFLVLTMANIGLPLTGSFVGEYMILLGIFKISKLVAGISALTMVLGGGYSLWLYNRVAYGNFKVPSQTIKGDLSIKEKCQLIPLVYLVILMGVKPIICLEGLEVSVLELICT